ncbi:MAG: hypothetical protein AB7F64_05235 [Gammaproteobacteria bacterium]
MSATGNALSVLADFKPTSVALPRRIKVRSKSDDTASSVLFDISEEPTRNSPKGNPLLRAKDSFHLSRYSTVQTLFSMSHEGASADASVQHRSRRLTL